MSTAKDGDKVAVHYTGTLNDGTVFDSSVDREPLEFTLGMGQMIAGFEKAVVGMHIGQSKVVTIPSGDAYGDYDEDIVRILPRCDFPDGGVPSLGQQFRVRQEDGKSFIVMVVEIDDENVTLDANHPLAGQDLTFDITLVSIA
jgi:peptidylprolyl isomerase